jgi:hypothetical protein
MSDPVIQELWYCTNATCAELNVYKAAFVAGYEGVTCGNCQSLCTKEDLVVDPRLPHSGRGTYGSHQS